MIEKTNENFGRKDHGFHSKEQQINSETMENKDPAINQHQEYGSGTNSYSERDNYSNQSDSQNDSDNNNRKEQDLQPELDKDLDDELDKELDEFSDKDFDQKDKSDS